METAFNEWDFYPLHLKPKEINDPLLILHDFFADDSLAGHLERLKEWRDYVSQNQGDCERQISILEGKLLEMSSNTFRIGPFLDKALSNVSNLPNLYQNADI